MKKVYFHIGSEKCGSSFITRFFTSSEPKRELLARHKVYSSSQILQDTAPLVPFRDKPLAPFKAIGDRVLKPFLNSALNGVFVTQEAFLGLVHGGAPNATSRHCEILEVLCQGFEVHPIIVLRRQDTFLESLYNQMVKRGELRPFQEFLGSLCLANYEWDAVVATVFQHFDNVHVIPFEAKVLKSAGDGGVVEAILRTTGLPLDVDPHSFPPLNPSLPLRFIDVQRAANEAFNPDEARRFADCLVTAFPKRPDESHRLFDPYARRRLLERYTESNARLFELYLPWHDPSYYLDGTA